MYFRYILAVVRITSEVFVLNFQAFELIEKIIEEKIEKQNEKYGYTHLIT